MTRDEILALSDAELVRHVAEQVMGWMSRGGCLHRVDDRCDYLGSFEVWQPLKKWDHTAQVWEAMRAKGFGDFTLEYEKGFRPIVMFGNRCGICEEVYTTEGGNERRAILQCALIAVNAREDGK